MSGDEQSEQNQGAVTTEPEPEIGHKKNPFPALASVEFEVFGQVQGCYFTKYCKELAEQLGVGGWVKNSKKGTIVGKIQGNKAQLDHMIDWLTTAGSPGSKIEKCELTNWEYLARLDYNNFSIRF